MNDIHKLKENYSRPTKKEIYKVINQRLSTTESLVRENELRLAEDQQKIEDLSRQLSVVKDKLDVDQRLLEDKTKQLKAENEKLEDLETKREKILKKNYSLERRCQRLRLRKPNIRDQCILDLGQKKYTLYKQLTRIRWDFGALDQATKGFVTDKNSYIRPFCYPKDIKGKELADLLWEEIQRSTDKKFYEDGDKENDSPNAWND